MESISSHPSALEVLRALTRAEEDARLNGADGGLSDLRVLWQRHVRESEGHVLHILSSTSHAPDGLVGFFLAEHTDLTTRLNGLAGHPVSSDRTRSLVQLIHRLMLHVSMEARALPPLNVRPADPDVNSPPGTA